MAKMVNWPEFACNVTVEGLGGGLTCAHSKMASGTNLPVVGRRLQDCPGSPGPAAAIQMGVEVVWLMLETLRLLPLKFLIRNSGWLASSGASRSCPVPPELTESLPALAVCA